MVPDFFLLVAAAALTLGVINSTVDGILVVVVAGVPMVASFSCTSLFSSAGSTPSNSCSSSEETSMQVSVGTDDEDDVEVAEDDDNVEVGTFVKNVPVRSNSRMVPSAKPAITKHPEDVTAIDVHSSLMGNDEESRSDDDDDDDNGDGIFLLRTTAISLCVLL